jgi:hypothetical protein
VITLSGSGQDAFELSTNKLDSIAIEDFDGFTIVPKHGLGIGNHVATVTISGDNIVATFDVSLVVENNQDFMIALDVPAEKVLAKAPEGFCDRSYGDFSSVVKISNIGSQATGALTVELGAGGASSFTLTPTAISSIDVGDTATFTIMPKNGLTVGTYTDTVTVRGDHGISETFSVSFEVISVRDYLYELITYVESLNPNDFSNWEFLSMRVIFARTVHGDPQMDPFFSIRQLTENLSALIRN